MRYNGTLEYYIEPEVQMNEYGEIDDSEDEEESGTDTEETQESEETETETETSEWSESIPCSISTIRNNNNARYQATIERVASFNVLIPITSGYDFKSRARVRLTRDGESLGEYEVILSERIPTQGRIKIVV